MRTSNSKGTSSTAAALLLAVVGLGASGCELLSADRSKIPGASASGGAGGAGGQGGTVGQGGGGAGGSEPIPCASPAECPGADNECQTRTCEAGICGFDHAPLNKPVMQQTASDCLRNVCDGQGSIISVNDDLDVIVDGDPCTSDLCASGVPANPTAPVGTPCAVSGGNFCDGAGACVECLVGGDCPTGACAMNLCVAATCGDGATNGGESDLDCGGSDCVPCADLLHCWVSSDCQSEVCQSNVCKAPICFDAVENGLETDVDCGGPICVKCTNGQGCNQPSDCISNTCFGGLCVPSCSDGAQNGLETDVDCGGPICQDCVTGDTCLAGGDCLDGVCTSGVCAPPICGDGVVNAGDACDDGNQSNADACLIDCTLNVCGDGHVNAGVEPCDDGNQSNTDACLTGCVLPSCGDGFLWAGVEVCDDGNTAPGDGCSPTCAQEGCGDGVLTPPELCDDGNPDNDDACPNNCVPAACGDGFLWAGVEACDDGNQDNNDACLNTCAAAICGDGVIRAGVETCDDGDAADNDGCAAWCAVEAPYACAGEPSLCASSAEINCNDGLDNDGDAAIDCADADCAIGCHPAVNGCGPGETLLVYTSTDVPKAIPDLGAVPSTVEVGGLGVVNKAAVQINITHIAVGDLDLSIAGPASPSIDLASDVGGFGDHYTDTLFNTGCPAITGGAAPFTGCFAPEQSLALLNGTSAKGIWTFTAADDTNTNPGTLNAWGLALCVLPSTCGDGVIDPGEACDDGDSTSGDGCTGQCQPELGWTCTGEPTVCTPICGDGALVTGEGCDDANLSAGDGCSPLCMVEQGSFCGGVPSDCIPGEVEPNNSVADADARALDQNSIYITGDASYGGSIAAIGDKDYFKLQVAADTVVRFETFGPIAEDCPSGLATQVRVYNAAGAEIVNDFNSGIGNCSLLTLNLTAGTYYVSVEDSGNNGTIPAYRLSVDYIPCVGTEAELNDAIAQANPLPGDKSFCIAGGHQVTTDIDMFLLNLPIAGKDVLAEIIEGSTAETCESTGIDSNLNLLDAAGNPLGTDDTDGRGSCSKIDGSGTAFAPVDAWASNLPAGAYYLQVWSSASAAAAQFDYRLVVTVR